MSADQCFENWLWVFQAKRRQKNKSQLVAAHDASDTAGCLVRVRETSVVCMRLEEEEDGALLMLMRELSASVINIGGLTAKTMEFLGLI